MLEDALAYPRRKDDLWSRHTQGVAFLLFGFLLPVLLVYGYIVRVVRGLARDDPEPPAWEAWEGLFVDGIKYVVVSLVYGLRAAVLGGLIAAVAGVLAVGLMRGAPGWTLAVAAVLGVMGFATALVGLLAAFLLPAAVVHFVVEDDLMAAFDVGTVAANAVSRPYLVAWLQTVAAGIVLGLNGALLAVILVGFRVVFMSASSPPFS